MDFQNLRTRLFVETETLLKARPILKYVLLAQLSGLLISLIGPIFDLLVLVPSDLFRMHIWRIISNLFLENNFLVIAWTTYCFQQFIFYIYPNWPMEEIVKYIIIVQLGTVFSFVISTLFLYIFASAIYTFYYAQIYGTSALAVAALVSLKQFLPDSVLINTPYGRLKNGHLPFSFLILSVIFWVLNLLRGTIIFQLLFSVQISWTYLRFFQSRGGIGQRMIGDRSEHFSWASLFPRMIQPLATIIGRLTFRTLGRLGVLKRVMRRENFDYIEEQTLRMESLEVTNPVTAVLAPESWDAERKRQKALRMLNERLASKNPNPDFRVATDDIHGIQATPVQQSSMSINDFPSAATPSQPPYLESPTIFEHNSSPTLLGDGQQLIRDDERQQQTDQLEPQKPNDNIMGYY